jgi:hypothetical protein
MKLVLVALLALLGCGCTGSPYKKMVEIRIAAAFVDENIEKLVAGADDWCAADKRLCLPVTVQLRNANVKPTWRAFCKRRAARTYFYLHRGPVIRICVNPSKHLRQVMTHELGHAMAGREYHLEEDQHIMSPIVRRSSRITEQDVEYVTAEMD